MAKKANRSPDAHLVTRLELARRLRCDPRTICKWQEEGLPVARRGRGGRASLYDVPTVRAWRRLREAAAAKEPALAASRARQANAQAAESEQRVATRARQLIAIEDVERIWSDQVIAVRARALALPAALADRLLRIGVTEGAAGIERLLQAAVDEMLRELADGHAPATPGRGRKAAA